MSLIGKKVIITDRESWYFGERGTVVEEFGGQYAVAIADGQDSMPVFDRWQFRVPRKEKKCTK